MIQISVLLPENHRAVSLAAIMDVFTTVNRISALQNSPPPFSIRQLAVHDGKVSEKSDWKSFPEYRDIPLPRSRSSSNSKTGNHIILIPAFTFADIQNSISQNRIWVDWLRDQYRSGSSVATFCTGAFLAASAGLFDGKSATTHVMYADSFSRLFPNVHFDPEAVVTADERMFSSGGSTSSFHLMLHLISRYCNRQTAIRIAKIFAIDPDRATQAYFQDFLPAKAHRDPVVTRLQEEIENHYHKPFSIHQVSESLPASRRTVYRRFRKLTGLTPHGYLQQYRVQQAKNLLETTALSVNEVMFKCGYNDSKAFRDVFKKITGLTPAGYRKKYSPQI